LFQEFVIARARLMKERNRDVSLAWHTAALARQKTLPKLEKLLMTVEKKAPQTANQLKQSLTSIFGPPKLKTRG
jgi:pyruvate-formate lyase-activating enzyme